MLALPQSGNPFCGVFPPVLAGGPPLWYTGEGEVASGKAARRRGENEMAAESKAVVTVLGFDRKGIIAGVSNVLFERGINILDISQTIVDGYFNMVMVVDLSEPTCPFDELQGALNDLGKELGLQIRIQKSEIFEAMHQV